MGLAAAQTNNCLILTDKSVCGPEYKGLPVLSSADSFSTLEEFDKSIKDVLNPTIMSEHYASQFQCNRTNVMRSLGAIRYQNTFWCSFYVTYAISQGCKSTNSEKPNGFPICKQECHMHVSTVNNSISSCSNKTAAEGFLNNLTNWCTSEVGDEKSQCSHGIAPEDKYCGWTNINFCKQMKSPDDCCKKALNITDAAPMNDGSKFPWWVVLFIVLGCLIVLSGLVYLAMRRKSRSVEQKQETFAKDTESPEIKSPNSSLDRKVSKVKTNFFKKSTPSLAEDLEKSKATGKLPITTLNTFFGGEGTEAGDAEKVQTPESQVDPKSATSPEIDTIQSLAKAVQDEKSSDVGQIVVVTDTYQATGPDELNLVIGDLILVKAQYDDGWAVGIEQREKKEGVFPIICTAQIVNAPSQIDPDGPLNYIAVPGNVNPPE
jgi:hypothetical protein